MIDIQLARTQPEVVKENLARRKNPELLVRFDELIKADQEWREGKTRLQELQKRRNEITREIATLKKAGQDITAKLTEMKDLPLRVKEEEEKIAELEGRRKQLHQTIPNLMHESVPYGVDDSENQEVRRWGEIKEKGFPLKSRRPWSRRF